MSTSFVIVYRVGLFPIVGRGDLTQLEVFHNVDPVQGFYVVELQAPLLAQDHPPEIWRWFPQQPGKELKKR